jgi:hypothetical protein
MRWPWFQLPDLTEGALRRAGVNLGIKDAEKLPKEQLIREIKKATKADGELLLAPLVVSTQSDSVNPSSTQFTKVSLVLLLLSSLGTVATAILTYGISSSNAKSAKTASAQFGSELKRIRESSEKEDKASKDMLAQSWQELAVYEIVSRGFGQKEHWNGLTLEEIQREYRSEAAQGVTAKEVELGGKDVSVATLKNVLLSLMKYGLVAVTVEGRYIVSRFAVSPRWQRSADQLLIQSELDRLLLLENREEAYTEDALYQAVASKVRANPEDYRLVVAAMQELGQVEIDKGRIWSPQNPPKKVH